MFTGTSSTNVTEYYLVTLKDFDFAEFAEGDTGGGCARLATCGRGFANAGWLRGQKGIVKEMTNSRNGYITYFYPW